MGTNLSANVMLFGATKDIVDFVAAARTYGSFRDQVKTSARVHIHLRVFDMDFSGGMKDLVHEDHTATPTDFNGTTSTFNLVSGDQSVNKTLFRAGFAFAVGPIPVTISAGVAGKAGLRSLLSGSASRWIAPPTTRS